MLYEKVLELGSVDFINTEDLNHEQWLKLRTTGIGGSDAGSILGLNKYASPLSVYLSKKDFARFEGNSATEWGNILEDPVRQKTIKELGIDIEVVPGMFRNKTNSFMNANFDGLVYLEKETEVSGSRLIGLGGHEIKTSRVGDGFTSDEIPDSYYSQVQHYMAVTGLDWFLLTVFIFNTYEGKHYVIPRNDDFINHLVEVEKDFWENNVLADIAPSPTGNDNEMDLIKSMPMPEEIVLDSEFELLLDEKEAIDLQVKELQTKSDIIKETILMRLSAASNGENAEKTTAFAGSWKITYNTQNSRRVDTNALKLSGLYDQYTKNSTSKVLRITRQKG